MDIGDITDPNLDGDFKAIVEIRQNRDTSEEDRKALEHLLRIFKMKNEDLPDDRPTRRSEEKLRRELLEAVYNNNVIEMTSLFKKVANAGLSLTDPSLRDPQNNATILHTTLIQEKWDVGKCLIQLAKDYKLLDDVFTVTVRKLTSDKTCLHILAEKGQNDLARALLNRISNPARRTALINAEVLTELEGQRPRHLASIHLAALHGHTNLIELLLAHGVSVNWTNNKNDTPVLWAARGNKIETVRFLISHGANLHLANDKGSTPLYWAVRYGFTDLVRLLVSEGRVNINQRRKLGLVTPIVLASALGHRDIVDVLLDHGADVEASMGNGTTALHAAAFEGNNDVIKLLISKGHAQVDQTDSAGNTALLCAARVGRVATMNTLIGLGASIDTQNKLGETVWHYAVHKNDNSLLEAVVGLYWIAKKIEPGTKSIKFTEGRNPLQVAVAADRVEKIKCLLQIGADARATDLNGNTFYHLAARDGRVEIVKAFLEEVDLADVNKDGDTPLHLAARSGHTEVVSLMINKSKLDARNKLGMTPLHEAVVSDATSPEMIRMIIDIVVKANNWSLVDAVEKTGNTALHIAARRGRPEIIAELAALNAKARNHDGDTPFHVAARAGHAYSVEKMLEVFNRPEKGFNVDEMTSDGQSALHLSAARGDWSRVELLVAAGADLALQDTKGNTPLHLVVEQSVKEPTMVEALLQVVRIVVRCATRWWCTKNDRQQPTDESELYFDELRTAMLYLTSEVFNRDGLNVVALATVRGSIPMVEELLNIPNVYRFRERDNILYDVTFLAPHTTPTTFSKRRTDKSRRRRTISDSVGILDGAVALGKYALEASDAIAMKTVSTVVGPVRESCLELIVAMPDEILAARMLEVAPYKQLVRNQWSGYQWIYGLLMLIHIAYMILYTKYVIPNSNQVVAVYNTSSSSCPSFSDSPSLYGLFLIWPIGIVCFMIYYSLSTFIRYMIKSRCLRFSLSGSICPKGFRLFELPFHLLSFLFYYLAELSAIAFGGMAITWYVLYRCGTTAQAYVQVTSVVFIIGWMFSLNFTKGFEAMHAFSIMLQYIIIRDITRFLLMYVFVLLGFGLAFHTLFQISQTLSSEYGSLWNTLFTVFNLMIGLGMPAPLDNEFESKYASAGGNPAFVYWVYILYVAVASIIMMNLLVAMMSNTFANIKSNEGTTWKVGSLRLGLRIESSMPFLQSMMRCTGRDRVFYDTDAGRWMISVPSGDIVGRFGDSLAKDETIDAMLKVVQRLEAKMNLLHTLHDEIGQQVDSHSETIRRSGDSVVFRRRPLEITSHNVALTTHGRPNSTITAVNKCPVVLSASVADRGTLKPVEQIDSDEAMM